MLTDEQITAQARNYSPKGTTSQKAFKDGADYILRQLAVEGFDSTVGATIDSLVKQLRSEVRDAQLAREQLDRKREEIRSLTFSPDVLDGEAKKVVALVSTLVDSFVAGACPASSHDRGFSVSTPSDAVYRKITEAVSYITWAHLTKGAPMPGSTDDEG